VDATKAGFVLAPRAAHPVVVLAPPIDGPAGSILALLEGGEPWSTSALAYALGASQRTVQRAFATRRVQGGASGGSRALSRWSRRRSPDSRQPCCSPGRCCGALILTLP